MIENFDAERLASAPPGQMEELLESGNIIHFPVCPIELPTDAELELLREQARFALRSEEQRKLLPHGKAIRLQVGGMRGLVKVLRAPNQGPLRSTMWTECWQRQKITSTRWRTHLSLKSCARSRHTRFANDHAVGVDLKCSSRHLI